MTAAGGGPSLPWWREAVVYQIYPRSFADTDGDGIGDLRGIVAHLDYLNDGTERSLGIDAVWLSPIYPSPLRDGGYDVADYCAVAPELGTLDDFRTLVTEAHRRGIRVILDLVLNHCSSEHPWFVEARAARASPRRDWFVWHDGRPAKGRRLDPAPGGDPERAGDDERRADPDDAADLDHVRDPGRAGDAGRTAGLTPSGSARRTGRPRFDRRPRPPNNWRAAFGGSAWEWEPATRQFYLHSFLAEQPDLDWRNERVKRAMWDVARFWLDLGADGFRLDAVNWLVKDAALRDNPRRLLGRRPYDRQRHVYDRNRPETIEIAKELRRVVDAYPERVTVGEVFAEPPGDPVLSAAYYAGGRGLHLAFDFSFLYCPWRADAFARAIARWEAALGPDLWPTYTLGNHDQPRLLSRYGGRRADAEARARVAAAMLLTLRGTPFLYYGDEIGMRSGRIPRARLHDPIGKRYWPFHPGRDPARTPMQWSAAPGAGFGAGEPWLPINRDYPRVNVEVERARPGSLLAWYRTLIHLRRREPALRRGGYARLPQEERDVLCYERRAGDERIAVALSFTAAPRRARFPAGRWTPLLAWPAPGGSEAGGTTGASLEAGDARDVALAGNGVLILKASPA